MTETRSEAPTGREPRHPPPPGACDAHCHVFGPAARFPFAPGRRYTPRDAPKEELFALHARLGIERGVIVQATCHGTDNRALLDALAAGGGLYRGVAVVEPDVSDAELLRLHEAGVRGLRVNFVPRLVDPPDPATLVRLADRIASLGWHLVVYFPISRLADLEPLLRRLPVPVVIDHMALPDPAAGPDGPEFRRLRRLAAACGHIWVKLSCPERISRAGPPFPDVAPLCRALLEEAPERVLWGTDWPHPNVAEPPDEAELVDFVHTWAPEVDARRRLFVDNPRRLYWPGEATAPE